MINSVAINGTSGNFFNIDFLPPSLPAVFSTPYFASGNFSSSYFTELGIIEINVMHVYNMTTFLFVYDQ